MIKDNSATNDGTPAVKDPESDGLSQDEFSDPLSSGDESDFELDGTLIEQFAVETTSQDVVTVSKDTKVATNSEPMEVETVMVSETTEVTVPTNPGPSTSTNVLTNVTQTNTGGVDGNEDIYVKITNRERKTLRKKWRNHIKTTKAPSSREDYVKWIKNEIAKMKEQPQTVNSAVQQRVQPKRIRSDDSTPNKNEQNKRRREGTNVPARYNEIVASANMVIVQSDYPKSVIDADQAELIKSSLLTALDEETDLAPNFKEIRHTGGALHVACLDDESKQWIVKVVPTIQPWESANLKAIPKEELVKYVKAVVYIPYSDLPKETILRRLAIQNRGLNTSVWRFVRMKEEKVGQTMVVLVDEESAEFLHNKNLMVGLNFTQVKFRFPKKNEGMDPVIMEEDEPGTDQEGTTAANAEPATANTSMFPPLPPPSQSLLPNASTPQKVPTNPVSSSRSQVNQQRATSMGAISKIQPSSSREVHGTTPERNRDRYSSSRHRRKERSRDRREKSKDDRSQSSRKSSSSRHRSESPERRKSQGRHNPKGK